MHMLREVKGAARVYLYLCCLTVKLAFVAMMSLALITLNALQVMFDSDPSPNPGTGTTKMSQAMIRGEFI